MDIGSSGERTDRQPMRYEFLKERGILGETAGDQPGAAAGPPACTQTRLDLVRLKIPRTVLRLVDASLARQHTVIPAAFDGETVTLYSTRANDIALADRLRFLLAKNVRLKQAPAEEILRAIDHYYGRPAVREDSDLELDIVDAMIEEAPARPLAAPAVAAFLRPDAMCYSRSTVPVSHAYPQSTDMELPVFAPTSNRGNGMFYHVVEEGQRVLVHRSDGRLEVIEGPRRVWRFGKRFSRLEHHVAHPGEFLIVRFRDGRQEHHCGPSEIWLDPRVHLEISQQEALQLAAKEAVVVYSKAAGSEEISRRIVFGPAVFVPEPGEWLHTFSWHASEGGSTGTRKVPKGLVFQKLWLMPDQMYHDVSDVRTGDDAVVTIRLMLFFELINIEQMLDTTRDPIGDFVNAATSDVVEFVGKHDFESFKQNTDKLNELGTYRQLSNRAAQCGYRINKVVYRGYGTADSLQQMHGQAIEARTRLQLDRATEEQAQELEDFRLERQLARAANRRTEQAGEVTHDLQLAAQRQQAELARRRADQEQAREQLRSQAAAQLEIRRQQDAHWREHLAALRDMSVDLTAYLTQARADRVIEVRGTGGTHLHLEADGQDDQPSPAPESESE